MSTAFTHQPQHSAFGKYKRWLRLSLYTILLLAGQCTATLLGRFYFDKGGKSIWIATSVQSGGFPVLIPLLLYSAKSTNHDSSKTKTEPRSSVMILLYLSFGLMSAVMDLLYTYGLSCLPLSTFALVCATQLTFNAVATYLINSQKFTALILNSVVVLTMSVILIALNTESEDTNLPKEKQLIGIFCALAASAMFALHQSLLQLYFVKIAKTEETYPSLLRMNFYPMVVASVVGLVGLFGSGDWRSMGREMKEFKYGGASYVLTLVWTAVTWQIACIGMLGLIFEVSSLFSVVIGNLELTITPILAVFVFHDKIYGVKIIAFLLATAFCPIYTNIISMTKRPSQIKLMMALAFQSWVNATKFISGASAVGSIAIPAILKHAGVISWGALAMELSSFFVFVSAIMCYIRINDKDDYSIL